MRGRGRKGKKEERKNKPEEKLGGGELQKETEKVQEREEKKKENINEKKKTNLNVMAQLFIR